MTTRRRVTYGKGGFDPAKPAANVVDAVDEAVEDLPPAIANAFGVLRAQLDPNIADPTPAQLGNALAVIVGRLVVASYLDG